MIKSLDFSRNVLYTESIKSNNSEELNAKSKNILTRDRKSRTRQKNQSYGCRVMVLF